MTTIERLMLVAAMTCCGCASDHYSLRSSTAPGTASEVLVLGSWPSIAVGLEGSGPMQVEFDGPVDSRDDLVTVVTGEVVRSMPGPVTVRIEPLEDRGVDWRLQAWNSTGLAADLLIESESR